MTIIAGIICKDAIVLASDSQTTTAEGGKIKAKKLHRVDFRNSICVVATSGNVTISQRFLTLFSKLAADTSITTGETVADTMKRAMREARKEFGEQNDHSSEALQKFLVENPDFVTKVMVASFFKATPKLHKLDIITTVPEPVTNHCDAIGMGSDLGLYLLKLHTEPQMEYKFATAIALHTIQTVIDNNIYCGPPTQIAVVKRFDNPFDAESFPHLVAARIFAEDEVQQTKTIVDAVNTESLSHWNKHVSTELRKQTKDAMAKMFDRFVEDGWNQIVNPDETK